MKLHLIRLSLLLFSRLGEFGRVSRRVSEQVDKDGLVLFEDDVGHGKVPLQPLDLLPELGLQVGHVGPLLDLAEEDPEAELATAEKARQGDAVSLDGSVHLAHRRQVGVAASHVQGTSQPVQLIALNKKNQRNCAMFTFRLFFAHFSA